MLYEDNMKSNLQIDIPVEYDVKKHDLETQGLQCWKSVDFVIEMPDKTLYIEFKDPENPAIPYKHREAKREDFLVNPDQLLDELSEKARMSFLYEYAMGRAKNPVYYYVIIGLSRLDIPILSSMKDKLNSRVPVIGPKGRKWGEKFISECGVFNVEQWNKFFPNIPIIRKSMTEINTSET